MTEAQMREAVKQAFVQPWADATNDVPLACDNEAMPSADVWAALTITTTTSQQATVGEPGSRLLDQRGWIVVKIAVPVNTGTTLLDSLCEIAKGLTRTRLIPSPVPGDEPIDTFASSTQPGGISNRWFQQLVRTPFRWFETV